MTTRIEVINRALVDIGAAPVTSEDDPPGDSYVRQYETHVGSLVSSYPWSFQTTLVKLARLVAPPEVHWEFVYDLPADMRGSPRAVYPNSSRKKPTADYEIRGRQLFADHADVWLRYTRGPQPALWPDYFLALAVLVLKAQFALSVREDSVLWRTLTEHAFGPASMMGEGGKVGEARAVDAGSQPSRVIDIGSNPLTDVRLS